MRIAQGAGKEADFVEGELAAGLAGDAEELGDEGAEAGDSVLIGGPGLSGSRHVYLIVDCCGKRREKRIL